MKSVPPARAARKEADQGHRNLFDGIPIGIFRTTPSGRILEVNPALARLLGHPDPKSLKRENAVSFYQRAGDRERWKEVIAERDSVADFEYPIRRRDGRIIWVRENARAVRDGRGRVLYYEGSLEDISAAKLAERALAEAEEKYRSLLRGVADEVFLLDRGGRILLANDAAEVSLGSGRPLAGKTIRGVFPPEVLGRFRAVLARVLRRRRSAVHVDWRAGRCLESVISPLLDPRGRAAGVTVVSRDITEREQAAEALAAQEKLYRALFELSPSGIILEDARGKIVDANATVCRNLGYSRNELLGMTVFEIASPKERGPAKKNLAKILAGETLHHVVRNIRRDGVESWMELYETRFPLSGQTSGILVLSHDITDRMKMEASLRESEEQFRALFDLSPAGKFLLDLSGNIVAANRRACEIFGYPPAEIVGTNARQIVPRRLAGGYPRLLAAARKRRYLQFETTGRRRGGEDFPLELTVGIFPWKGREHLQAVFQDIGERRRAEEADRLRGISEALVNSQEEERKMLAWDLHDGIGQDLAALKIGLEMNRAAHPECRKEIGELSLLADKALSDLRSLAASLRPASLDELGLVPALRRELSYLAQRGGLVLRFESRRCPGRLPPDKELVAYRIVQEAMTNIVKHARASRVRVSLSRKRGHLRIAVSDDGRGFRPGGGSAPAGLGLPGMRERISLAGGKFSLSARPGRGTRIAVSLPLVPGKEKAG